MKLLHGDCLEVMRTLPDNSVDAIVTDPPYGLSKEPDIAEVLTHWLNGDDYVHKGGGFMGKTWDSFVPGPAIWREALRVLKPGGHMLAFFGTRTYDIGVIAIRLAGFEVRDTVAWVYGSGFPKSHAIGKAIDKRLGAEREVVGAVEHWGRKNRATRSASDADMHFSYTGKNKKVDGCKIPITAPATPEAQQWEGFGTAVKPAFEPIVLARKPFKGTIAANVLEHGTGGLNIDATRIPTGDITGRKRYESKGWKNTSGMTGSIDDAWQKGRFPANFIHDGSESVLELFPESVARPAKYAVNGKGVGHNGNKGAVLPNFGGSAAVGYVDKEVTAARFFYAAKASKRDRDEGLPEGVKSTHPTVKPLALCQYLVRLITPPGGIVLDPFMGSGSTGKACAYEGFDFIGIEQDAEYLEIAKARIKFAMDSLEQPLEPKSTPLFGAAD